MFRPAIAAIIGMFLQLYERGITEVQTYPWQKYRYASLNDGDTFWEIKIKNRTNNTKIKIKKEKHKKNYKNMQKKIKDKNKTKT